MKIKHDFSHIQMWKIYSIHQAGPKQTIAYHTDDNSVFLPA